MRLLLLGNKFGILWTVEFADGREDDIQLVPVR